MEETRYPAYAQGLDEKLKRTETGVEYWMARDVMLLLGYTDWRNFRAAIERGRSACQSAKVPTANHFVEINDMVAIGSGAQREREDWYLSRYACSLIAMNADSTKPEVGFAMTYFAVQTRRQELSDEQKRLELRLRILEDNHKLAGAAKKAGVVRYPLFQDAGYRGLYGMGLGHVKTHKGLKPNQDLLDHAGRLELAANEFRVTLTEHRLNRDQIRNEPEAISTHRAVGEEVRSSIMKDNGVRPEDLPVEQSIKPLVQKHQRQLKARQKS